MHGVRIMMLDNEMITAYLGIEDVKELLQETGQIGDIDNYPNIMKLQDLLMRAVLYHQQTGGSRQYRHDFSLEK